MTAEVGEILEELGWSVECLGETYVKGKANMITHLVDPKSVPNRPPPIPGNSTLNNRQDVASERRRSSQLSLSSLKSRLTSQHGSLDISTGKGTDTDSTKSFTMYKPIKSEDTLLTTNYFNLQSVKTHPRGSLDSKMSELEKGTSNLQQLSSFTKDPSDPGHHLVQIHSSDSRTAGEVRKLSLDDRVITSHLSRPDQPRGAPPPGDNTSIISQVPNKKNSRFSKSSSPESFKLNKSPKTNISSGGSGVEVHPLSQPHSSPSSSLSSQHDVQL